MSLERFCRKRVVTAFPDELVDSVAEKMSTSHVGAVVVVDEHGAPVGIVTDRDITTRIVAAHRDAGTTPVRYMMTEPLTVVRRSDDLDTALFAMRDRGVRRLPIVDAAGRLEGLVSMDDFLVLFSGELRVTAEAVRENQGP